ncbi:MAG: helix-turn-helix transcriptional regulator [Myxococcales bacterium FL481]|nr:MAG: helix-turn-helix transcriptional regulator [Myxococcales bacterium FL481]
MPKARSYRLLCPIARALDRIGDRWALLILRDLHAGPARFGELDRGLPGLATNLLTTRLETMVADGLIERRTAGKAIVYALTAAGERTAPLLFELAMWGAQWPPPTDPRAPGNLRTVVVTLSEILRRAATSDDALDLELVVDEERFGIVVGGGNVSVRYGARPEAPDAMRTQYEAFMAAGDGRLSPQEFLAKHVVVERGDGAAIEEFLRLLR